MSSVVSITTADMEKEAIDPTPEDVFRFRKMNKADLENTAYAQLQIIKELRTTSGTDVIKQLNEKIVGLNAQVEKLEEEARALRARVIKISAEAGRTPHVEVHTRKPGRPKKA